MEESITAKADEKPGKKNHIKVILDMLTAVFFIVSIILLISSFLSKHDKSFLGFRSFIVLTGSMSPTFEAGSFIIVKDKDAEDIKAGDILTYEIADNVVLTHRVIKTDNTDGYSFITKGDANNIEDRNPVKEEQIIGVAVLWVNRLGLLLINLQQPGNAFLLISLMLFVFGVSEIASWILRKKEEGKAI